MLHYDDVFVDIGQHLIFAMLKKDSVFDAAGAFAGKDHFGFDGDDCAVFDGVGMVCCDEREFGDLDTDAMGEKPYLMFLVSEVMVSISH